MRGRVKTGARGGCWGYFGDNWDGERVEGKLGRVF